MVIEEGNCRGHRTGNCHGHRKGNCHFHREGNSQGNSSVTKTGNFRDHKVQISIFYADKICCYRYIRFLTLNPVVGHRCNPVCGHGPGHGDDHAPAIQRGYQHE